MPNMTRYVTGGRLSNKGLPRWATGRRVAKLRLTVTSYGTVQVTTFARLPSTYDSIPVATDGQESRHVE